MSPNYDPELLVESWIANSDAHEKAHAIDRYARYMPEIGWRAILTVLTLPAAVKHMNPLSRALEMLISQYGGVFIERIEQEALVNAAFKTCLASIHPNPTFPLPEYLWPRLSAAAGTSIGPMKANMARLYAKIPNLSEVATRDLHPPALTDVPIVSDAELLEHACAYITYEETFWAWEELDRILREEGLEAAWPLILKLVEKGSDRVLCAVGAGLLEDIIDTYGATVIERVEERARQDSRFRFCLSHVWPSSIPPAIWARVVSARGSEPQRG